MTEYTEYVVTYEILEIGTHHCEMKKRSAIMVYEEIRKLLDDTNAVILLMVEVK